MTSEDYLLTTNGNIDTKYDEIDEEALLGIVEEDEFADTIRKIPDENVTISSLTATASSSSALDNREKTHTYDSRKTDPSLPSGAYSCIDDVELDFDEDLPEAVSQPIGSLEEDFDEEEESPSKDPGDDFLSDDGTPRSDKSRRKSCTDKENSVNITNDRKRQSDRSKSNVPNPINLPTITEHQNFEHNYSEIQNKKPLLSKPNLAQPQTSIASSGIPLSTVQFYPHDFSVPPPPISYTMAAGQFMTNVTQIKSKDDWDKQIEAFLAKTARRSNSPERYRSRSPPRRRLPPARSNVDRGSRRNISSSPPKDSNRTSVTSDLMKEEREKLQEATWRQQAIDLGLDGDEYVAKLKEQKRLRDQRLAKKYAAVDKRIDLNTLHGESLPEINVGRTKKTIRLRKSPEPQEPKNALTIEGVRALTNTPRGTTIHVNPNHKANVKTVASVRPVVSSARMACVPRSSVPSNFLSDSTLPDYLRPENIKKLTAEHEQIIKKAQKQRPFTPAMRQQALEEIPKPPMITHRKVIITSLPSNDNKQTATAPIRRIISGSAKLKSAEATSKEPQAKEISNFRISIGGGVVKQGRRTSTEAMAPQKPVSTLSDRLNKHLQEANRKNTASIDSKSAVRTVRAVPVNTDAIRLAANVSTPKVATPPPPPTSNMVAEVAAVITGYNPDTPLKKFEVIAGTIGPIKMCRKDAKGRILIVFKETVKCAAFSNQYNGKMINGSVLHVEIDTFIETI